MTLTAGKQYDPDSCGAAALVCIGADAGWTWAKGAHSGKAVDQTDKHEKEMFLFTTANKTKSGIQSRSLPTGIQRGAIAMGKKVKKAWKSQHPTQYKKLFSWTKAIQAVDKNSDLKTEEEANADKKTTTTKNDTLSLSDLTVKGYYLLCINDCSHWIAYDKATNSSMSPDTTGGTTSKSGVPKSVKDIRIALLIG